MTIASLLKSAKSAYKGERGNLVCEILLAHFLGQNRVFLHANSEKKISEIFSAESSLDSATRTQKNSSLRADSQNRRANLLYEKIAESSLDSATRTQKNSSLRADSQNRRANLLYEKIAESSRFFLDFANYFTSPQALEFALLQSISRLNNGYPLEYITKKVSFYGMDFFIDEGALIPRTETELLVDKAANLIAQHDIHKIYEIGTGSGIIAITLCLQNPHIQITATDISPTALKIAQQNIAQKSALDSTLKKRIRLLQADLLQGTDFTPKDALIIANPPYIAKGYALPKNVAYEPKIALFGGKKGDEILQKIIALNAEYLCCEIGHNQGYLADFLGAYKSVEFYRDYAGFMRGFVAKRECLLG